MRQLRRRDVRKKRAKLRVVPCGNVRARGSGRCVFGLYSRLQDRAQQGRHDVLGVSMRPYTHLAPTRHSHSHSHTTRCDGGTYSERLAVNCTTCRAGTYSGSSASSCTACDSGKFADDNSASCDACDAGTFSNSSSAFCTTCAAGTYSGSSSPSCTYCGECGLIRALILSRYPTIPADAHAPANTRVLSPS